MFQKIPDPGYVFLVVFGLKHQEKSDSNLALATRTRRDPAGSVDVCLQTQAYAQLIQVRYLQVTGLVNLSKFSSGNLCFFFKRSHVALSYPPRNTEHENMKGTTMALPYLCEHLLIQKKKKNTSPRRHYNLWLGLEESVSLNRYCIFLFFPNKGW